MAENEIEFSIEDRSRYVRALYAFEANDNTQLTINPGDILEVFYRDDSGWWDGKNVSSNNDGYFPGNYTESLGDNLDIIKQQLLFEEQEQEQEQEEDKNNEAHHGQQICHDQISLKSSTIKESCDTDSSIDIRNAEPLSKRLIKCIKNDCNLCTIHHRALCNCICNVNKLDFEYFEYDAFIFRSLSVIQHTLCIFGAVSINHFISSIVDDIYNKVNIQQIVDEYGKTVFIRFILTIILTICFFLFLFLTSNTSLMFLKESPNNKQSTNKRDRNIVNNRQRQQSFLILCLRNFSLSCGKCGVILCRPYTFIYTQFVMLLCSYILAFLWQDLALEFQSMYLQNSLSNDWYKNIIFIIILLCISLFSIFLLKRKLNSVYHIYRYYSKQCKDNINNSYNLQNMKNSNDDKWNNMHPLPKSVLPKKSINTIMISKENNNNNNNKNRPYQVSLYLYFWCLLSEITLFVFALPLGSCFAAFCYWLLSSTQLWNVRMTRIITMILYIITFIIIYILTWRIIHINMHRKKSNLSKQERSLKKQKEKQKMKLYTDNSRRNSLLSISDTNLTLNTTTNTTANTNTNELLETQSNVSYLTTTTTMTMAMAMDEDIIIKEYESDIPDFIIMIWMKYYGKEIELTEFKILSSLIIGIFFCDIFIIGFWFNLWMLFDNDTDPFNNITNDDTGKNYDKYLNPTQQYLLYVSILTLILPFICSYLFCKVWLFFCCKKNNYKLSILLQSDKLWMKSLLSRWFIVIQSLILGYLWCEYFEVLWFKHIKAKYYTLSTGLWAIIIYIIIFIVIIVFKLNKKLLRLLWTMHNDINTNELEKKSGVGNLGLNASVKYSNELEKKLGRRMISYNTQKAKNAIINEEIEIIKNNNTQMQMRKQKTQKSKKTQKTEKTEKRKNNNHNKMMTGLSTSLLADDDIDESTQIL